jgi:hypothetical protein
MNDHELDRLIARANPYGDATVRHLPTNGAEFDLLEDIISTEAPEATPAPEPAGTFPGHAVADALPDRVAAGRPYADLCRPHIVSEDAPAEPHAVRRNAIPGHTHADPHRPHTVPGGVRTTPGRAPAVPSVGGAASPDAASRRRRRTGRRRAVVLLAAAATVAVALTGIFFPKGSSPIAPVSAYGAEVRAVTDATPRLLIDDPEWKIVALPVFRANEGEMKFARGKQTLQVNWIPAGLYGGGKPEMTMQLFGQTGKVYRSGKSTDLMLMMPPKGAYYLTMRGDVGSDAGFRSLVGKLKTVDTDTWLDAMPDSIVKQSDAPRVIDEMLADVPVLPSFDRSPFLKILVLDRYHFGAKVTEAVACGWFEQWAVAKKAGDKAKMKQATAAIQGSRNWKILQEMDKLGRFSEGLWQDGDRMADNEDPRERNGMCR